jgi:hypothetical protein
MSIAVRASRLRVHFGIDLLSASDHAPGRSRTRHVRRRAGDLLPSPNGLREKSVHRSGVELNPGAQRPREGPAPLGQAQAPEIGMQPCAPAGMPSPRVGNHDSLHRHHAQQSGSRRPGPATHTSPDWLGGPLLAAAPNVVRAGVDRPPTASRHDSSVSVRPAENRHWSLVPQRAKCAKAEPLRDPHRFGYQSSIR